MAVESNKHGIYEMRFQRLPSLGDSELYDPKTDQLKLKQKFLDHCYGLNLYYNEINKRYFNVCPAFYRFK